MTHSPQKLIPFICYAKENKQIIRAFSEKLKAEGWIDPWLDEDDILPGQVWQERVIEAVRKSHVVIIFLSKVALTNDGFFHKEMKLALDTAAEKPEGAIFIIPVRIDDCETPEVVAKYQYVDYFGSSEHKARAYSFLLASLKSRAASLNLLP
ncbi:MAG: toll/interleukin-1 receptor domain-containing protein [Anaerolineales bacterium]|nr:toll/interleukin-1 receptor domain-containing protein [Anaerolineales bacterium]MCZ2120937.1 toll/interleukin-1 receptor domain-containing protein [Anaerolineales bacterium]